MNKKRASLLIYDLLKKYSLCWVNYKFDKLDDGILGEYDFENEVISISEKSLSFNKNYIKWIVIHEIVHAFGYRKHDYYFKKKAKEIGCPKRFSCSKLKAPY